ncbi:MAG: ATP-binding protein [Cyclobacteriaceae bacterium]
MKYPENHPLEKLRLEKLESYSILDTLPEEDYDNLTAIAAEICGTPISLVSVLDDKRQWFKSHHGLDTGETPKEYAFCAHAINDSKDIFIVEDARKDKRFHDNPLVVDDPNVIFYAGVPLKSEEGLPMGTLCVIDNKPKQLTTNQLNSLRALARQVMNLFELREVKTRLEASMNQLDRRNKGLERFAMVAAHDIKSPLNNISQLASLFLADYEDKLDDDGIEVIQVLKRSSDRLRELVDGLLEYSRTTEVLRKNTDVINLEQLRIRLTEMTADAKSDLIFETELQEIHTNKTALDQILINLITNAIKYNDKDLPKIVVKISQTDSYYEISVKDNGPGIPDKHLDKIFEIFQVMKAEDRFGNQGNGIGLATVKKLVEELGGNIQVKSELGSYSQFIFTIAKKASIKS